MMGFKVSGMGWGGVVLGVVLVAPGIASAQAPAADLHKRYRADLPGEVRSVSPARLDRADVAADLRRSAAVGARDQGARGR